MMMPVITAAASHLGYRDREKPGPPQHLSNRIQKLAPASRSAIGGVRLVMIMINLNRGAHRRQGSIRVTGSYRHVTARFLVTRIADPSRTFNSVIRLALCASFGPGDARPGPDIALPLRP